MREISTLIRVTFACFKKDLRSVWTERAFLFQTLILPLNYNVLLMLFALSSSAAPTAVVFTDRGPYAQQFYRALVDTRSFQLQSASTRQAQMLLQAGEIVVVMTIPTEFDARLQANQP